MRYSKHKLLNIMLAEYRSTRDKSICRQDTLSLYANNETAFKSFEKLKAKGYIDFAIDPITGEIIGLAITDKAVTYSEDNIRRLIKDAIPIISLIISLISLSIDLFQWING